MDKIENNIRKYRLLANMTQKQLAEKLHLEHTTISNYERGIRKVDIETYALIASALNVTVKELTNIEVDVTNIDSNIAEPRRNLKVMTFDKEIGKIDILVKFSGIIIFLIIFLIPKFSTLGVVIIFFLLTIFLIIIDTFKILKPSKSIEELSVTRNSIVEFVSDRENSFKKFIVWIA